MRRLFLSVILFFTSNITSAECLMRGTGDMGVIIERATSSSVIKMLCKLLQLTFFFCLVPTAALAEEHQIVIKNFKFIPAEITIKAGDSITWLNQEKRQYHSVWFEQSGDPEPDYIFPDETYIKTFNEAGEFPYRCGPHPEMTGIVHVK